MAAGRVQSVDAVHVSAVCRPCAPKPTCSCSRAAMQLRSRGAIEQRSEQSPTYGSVVKHKAYVLYILLALTFWSSGLLTSICSSVHLVTLAPGQFTLGLVHCC